MLHGSPAHMPPLIFGFRLINYTGNLIRKLYIFVVLSTFFRQKGETGRFEFNPKFEGFVFFSDGEISLSS